MEIPEAITPLLRDHDGILLANHGALTLGSDLETAYYRMESMEHTARNYLALGQLGGGIPLAKEEVEALMQQKS